MGGRKYVGKYMYGANLLHFQNKLLQPLVIFRPLTLFAAAVCANFFNLGLENTF